MRNQVRAVKLARKTSETDIRIRLSIDGAGSSRVRSGIPFLDHMLTLLAKHGLFDLSIDAKGDLEIDIHHTNEDIGITLGQAFRRALGTLQGIRRYGYFSLPMDEALTKISMDFSGRPHLSIHKAKGVRFSGMDTYSFHDAREFLNAFCQHAGVTMHVEILAGRDSHHIIECLFKAWARAMDMATQLDPRVKGVPSTKGRL
jgi:imidazoleglycerol-phosphate dehydratase